MTGMYEEANREAKTLLADSEKEGAPPRFTGHLPSHTI